MTTKPQDGIIAATAPAPAPPSHFKSRLSSKAPINGEAKIKSRSSRPGGAITYTLQIGSVAMPDVSVFEVTEYISLDELEMFENAEFERECAEEEARLKMRSAAKVLARRSGRTTGGYASSSSSSSNSSTTSSSTSDESGSGTDDARTVTATTTAAARGRQRPTYTHFYPKQRARRSPLQKTASVQINAPDRPIKSIINNKGKQ
jgi:hypothetical protein